MTSTTLRVPAIHCDACVRSIADAVGRLSGVDGVDGDADARTVTVTYEADRLGLDLIRQAIDGRGFAVTGVGSTLSYLQRVAVDPRYQGTGIGRSLVRSAARWAKKEGATAIMLNTQVGNDPAIRLYESEGYDTLDEPLEVLISG